MSEPDRPRSREDYARGLPDHHDPTAGIGGARPARSALTLRLFLAGFGLVFCLLAGLGWLAVEDLPSWPGVVLLVLAVIAAVDLVIIVRRKARGEPG
ncbi:DUF6343 family protein [Blastococcus sp. SYSU DS0669]